MTEVRPAFSEACERNKAPILDVLQNAFARRKSVLEVGSGTGQHVVHFARALPDARWQPADQAEYLPQLIARLAVEAPDNVTAPVELDVRMEPWPFESFDAVFSANTLHYMGMDCVEAFFCGIGQVLQVGGVLAVYGPFRYNNEFTSESNARFDDWLKASDPVRGVRDYEWIAELALGQKLELIQDFVMPSNNQLLLWGKQTLL